jgi:4-hydroxy-3-polyprenylbenzoate decarboxylase
MSQNEHIQPISVSNVYMAWRDLREYLLNLRDSDELIRISHPVDCYLEAGCIADKLVKKGGPAIIFDQPRLANGEISKYPLAMNLFGTRERTNKALGVKDPKEIGETMVNLMKPDIGGILKKPWTGLGLAMQGMSMAPKKIKKGACQAVVIKDPDMTKLPIPTTWPMDGGPFITLPLVVTQDPKTSQHNMGMYRGQIFGKKEIGLHWQAHKHAADHADEVGKENRMPVAICLGGPPPVMFSAISPLPDNLSEYEFAGLLNGRRLRITKCLTNDLWVPSEVDFVIEGYTIPGETRTEGPFGDHFGYYCLEEKYPVMHVTAITHRKDPTIPMTIVGVPPMEDGYLGEAIGDAFRPVLQFQHRDVKDLFLPLETGFHNLAIVASKQRYPRQARKTALGLMGAGQMMFLKSIIAVDENHNVKDLDALLKAIDYNVRIPEDLIILDGMVADSLAHASPWQNVHSKLLIDATTPTPNDPRVNEPKMMGCPDSLGVSASGIEGVTKAKMMASSMLVVTTHIEGGPRPETSMEEVNEEAADAQRKHIARIRDEIWSLESAKNLRWLFITDDDADLDDENWRRRLLWQLFCRFEVARDFHFDENRKRVSWDATAPIPSNEGPLPVRRWPAVTLHDPEIEERVERWMEREGL